MNILNQHTTEWLLSKRTSAAAHGWRKRVGNFHILKTELSVTIIINPELSGGRVPLQDKYCHKTERESKWWASFSLQSSARALRPAVYDYLQTKWSCVCKLLRLDLPWRKWNSPSYRRSTGRPAVSPHFAERNGALCMNALSPWCNPFTARPLLHSWFSCGSRMALAAGRRRTPWLATASAWYEPHRENVEWGEKDKTRKLACPSFQK